MSKSGFVAIIGRPSAGKSTLLNTLCKEKVSITSPVPQTTRNKIRGIVSDSRGQIVFLDTPGYHQSDRKFNTYLRRLAESTLEEADAVLYVADLSRRPGPEERDVLALLAQTSLPRICALNKSDLPQTFADRYRELLAESLPESAIHQVSAVTGDGLPSLLDALFSALPEGEAFYDPDFYTDQAPEFRIAEIVREKAIARAREELPHAIYVEVADMEMREPEDGREAMLWARVFLNVERDSQKGILVGKGGEQIRDIRLEAQRELNEIFPYRIHLDLRVKVQPKWRTRDPLLRRMVQ